MKHKCLVFMDEAGLPEEEKESLKVLHYYLEGHMSAKAKVGFVAITNHVLDAAKSNRCVSLLRENPDKDEMLSIALGVLFQSHNVQIVGFEKDQMEPVTFSSNLCQAYATLLNDRSGKFPWFDTFYGLRDFIYFLKELRQRGKVSNMIFSISLLDVLQSFERNFNGILPNLFFRQANAFIKYICKSSNKNIDISQMLRAPMKVIEEALAPTETTLDTSLRPRYKLIVDECEDDSIMRLLGVEGLLDSSQKSLFKLSNMPENSDLEKLSLVSGVKFAALQGVTVILSQTDSINESFYDLFNHHFRCLTNRDGKLSLYANIAVGGISRRCRVHPSFQCIVHVRNSELPNLPAPFLNRFKKYTLKVKYFLHSRLQAMSFLRKIIDRSRLKVDAFISCLGQNAFFAFDEQTIDSIFLMILPSNDTSIASITLLMHNQLPSFNSFYKFINGFINMISSLNTQPADVEAVINIALNWFSPDLVDALNHLTSKKNCLEHGMIEKAVLEILNCKELSVIATLIENILQMTMTRATIFNLLTLITPESLFAKR